MLFLFKNYYFTFTNLKEYCSIDRFLFFPAKDASILSSTTSSFIISFFFVLDNISLSFSEERNFNKIEPYA